MTPALSTTNDERRATPSSASNTPYDDATAPCGQKSLSNGKFSPSVSAKTRREYVASVEIASTSVSKVRNSSSRSRITAISLVHTLENAQGKKTSATVLFPANDDSVTSCPNWSRRRKSGAGVPTASPVAGRSVGFGELTLEDLASRVAWELIEEHDLARNLVAGEVLPDPVLEVVLARRFGSDDHECLQALAELLVVDADRGHLDDGLVTREAVLDLLREDVLATRDDHLVVAALDVEPPVRVEAADVARRHQPVDDLLGLATAGVALEEHAVADEDAPGLALRHLAAVGVEDLHHRRPGRPAGRGRRLAEVARGGDRRVGDLGRAVDVVEVVAEGVHPLQGEVAGEGGAGGGGDLERGQRVAIERGPREVEGPLQHH